MVNGGWWVSVFGELSVDEAKKIEKNKKKCQMMLIRQGNLVMAE